MFECVLWGCIDVENSKIVLESSVEAHLTLKKKIPVKWPELISDQMSLLSSISIYISQKTKQLY